MTKEKKYVSKKLIHPFFGAIKIKKVHSYYFDTDSGVIPFIFLLNTGCHFKDEKYQKSFFEDFDMEQIIKENYSTSAIKKMNISAIKKIKSYPENKDNKQAIVSILDYDKNLSPNFSKNLSTCFDYVTKKYDFLVDEIFRYKDICFDETPHYSNTTGAVSYYSGRDRLYKKRIVNIPCIQISETCEKEIILHEIGHCCDFKNITLEVTFGKDGSLCDIYDQELTKNYDSIAVYLKNEYCSIMSKIIENFNFKKFMRFKNEKEKNCRFLGSAIDRTDNDYLFALRCDRFFDRVGEYCDGSTNQIIDFALDHVISSDAVSTRESLSFTGLIGHDSMYFTKKRPGIEFFANLFSAKLLNNKTVIEEAKKFFPKSYKAFSYLLDKLCYFYKHGQFNEPFLEPDDECFDDSNMLFVNR